MTGTKRDQRVANIGGAKVRLALVAVDETQRRAQRALLRSFGYLVEPYDSFDRFLADRESEPDCISIDLRGVDLSPAACVAEVRRNGIDAPLLLLVDRVAQGYSDATGEIRDPEGGHAYLFWQPLDVELFLATLAAVTSS